MIETVSKKVAPSQEQYTINIMTNFGWRVKSSQEINSKESHLERRGDELYSVTSKENYVKLLFERDTEMKNYAQIAQLEREYNAICASSKPKFEKKQILLMIVLLIFLLPIGIIYGVYVFFKNTKEAGEKAGAKLGPILQKARSLLS
ncbi:MAG: hypothetical protein E7645_04095 [Ruminococcaceae bacterium]|nr:hypothetical protein [Oscillospiraceae bacterium]